MDAKLYIQRLSVKISPVRKRWIGCFLALAKKDYAILEIGSGVGYESNYIEQKGFNIIRSDINKVFIEHQKKAFNRNVIKLDILSIPKSSNKKYKIVFADAVVTMFSPFKLVQALDNIRKLLARDGIFAFNLPLEWGINDIRRYVTSRGFKIIKYYQDKVWFYLVVKKLSSSNGKAP